MSKLRGPNGITVHIDSQGDRWEVKKLEDNLVSMMGYLKVDEEYEIKHTKFPESALELEVKEHTNPILQELINEITPEEMEETRKEMNSLTVAAFRDWWQEAIGLNSAAKQDCFCTCRDEITKLLNNEKQITNC